MIRRTLIRAAVLAGLWWVLAGPKLTGWYAGLAAIGLALLILASLARDPIPRIDPRGLSAFIPFFLVRVIQGGVDVSKRALSPTLPLSPDIVLYESRLSEGAPRTLFANTISLLPGTFTAELREDGLLVHLLARTPDSEAGLAELERRVGAVFGLSPDGGPEAE